MTAAPAKAIPAPAAKTTLTTFTQPENNPTWIGGVR